MSGSVGFTAVELMFSDNGQEIFSETLSKAKKQHPNKEELQCKTKRYLTVKGRRKKRKGKGEGS